MDSTHPRNTNAGSSKSQSVIVAAGIAALGFLSLILWATAIEIPQIATGIDLSLIERIILSTIGTGFAAVVTGVVYFQFSSRTLSYVDIDRLSKSHIKYTIGGFTASIAFIFFAGIISSTLGIESADHEIAEAAIAENNRAIFLWMIPISILIIGPAEEFIYRNLVQKRLYTSFSNVQSIGIASIIFALVHFPAYIGGTFSETIVSLIIVLLTSTIFGWLYVKTENLLVPSLAHGCYNAFIFATLYLTI